MTGRELLMAQQRARMEARRSRRKAEKLQKKNDTQRLTGGTTPKIGKDANSAIKQFNSPSKGKKNITKSSTTTSQSNKPSSSDVNRLTGGTTPKTGESALKTLNNFGQKKPQEGETKTQNGIKFVFRRGSWQRVKPN